MRVAVLDIGKTNSKLALVDTRIAEELEVITCVTPHDADSPPYPHVDVSALEDFLANALRTLASDGAIDAITVSAHGACGVLVDENVNPVLPVLDYEYAGPDSCREDYDRMRAPFAETGSPASPGGLNLGAQLFWQQRHFPDEFARATVFLTWPQFWIARLCGVLRNDPSSIGSHTDLHCPETAGHSTLVSACGWERLLPPLCRSGEWLGTLSSEWCARTGLSEDTAVHAGIHDSNASLVPHLLSRQPPYTVVSSGTWVILMAIGVAVGDIDPERDTLVNVDAFGRPVPSARFMGGRERALLLGENPPVFDQADISGAVASKVMLMPSVVPGTGPWPKATFLWLGDEASLTANQRDTLVSLYLAMMTAASAELLGASGVVAVEGPLARNLAYLQMLTVATGRAVQTGSSRTGTSVGIALLVHRCLEPDSPLPASITDTQTVEVDDETRRLLGTFANVWREACARHA